MFWVNCAIKQFFSVNWAFEKLFSNNCFSTDVPQSPTKILTKIWSMHGEFSNCMTSGYHKLN